MTADAALEEQMRSELRSTSMVGLAALILLIAAAAEAAGNVNFMALNRAFGAGSPSGTPRNGPATWTGIAKVAASAAPASFMVNAFDANWTTNFMNPTPPTQAGVLASSQVITVTGPLAPGVFKAGGGPGNFVFNPPPDPNFGTRIGTAQVIQGAHKFGGSVAHTFRYLSKLKLNFGFAVFQGTFPLSEIQGVKTPPAATKATQSFTGTFANTMNPASKTTIYLRANFFPWTTGVAIGKDHGGNFNTTVTLTGYDNRTAMGNSGNVQLVAPFLFSSFNAGAFGINHLSGVNTLKYQFLPEPGTTALFGAGVFAVLLLGLADPRTRRALSSSSDREAS
jgi:hypothetical protein